jgi:nucleoside-diphosphate-sugar epimerase
VKVLVTGAGGFVGGAVVRALAARGFEVVAQIRRRALQAELDRLERVRTISLELEDVDAVDAVLAQEAPDAVVHAAWYAAAGDYRSSAENLSSLSMTIHLAQRVIHRGCAKLIGIGSGLEYRPRAEPLRESDPTEPNTLYGATKLAAWTVMQGLARGTNTELVWARIFHVYGPGEGADRLLSRLTRELLAGRAVELSPGLQVRDQIHVDDVADALARLIDPSVSGIVNVCSGAPVTLRDVVTALATRLGRTDLLHFGARPYLPDEVMYMAGNNLRLQALGWLPRLDLEHGLADLIRDVQRRLSSPSGAGP